MLTLACAMTAMALPSPATLRQRGAETLRQIRQDLYIESSGHYAEEGKPSGRAGVCFNWPAGVQFKALLAGAKANREFEPWLRAYADVSLTYWNPAGPVPGFDVLPGPKSPDRYYDDNAWFVLALAKASDQLKEPKYLVWADRSLQFVLSGEDEKLGGGIYWREDRQTKNTCSNGPSAAAALAVYRQIRDARLLETAKRVYAWTKKNLQDPADGLYWDNIDLNGKIERTKWTYNTALMLQTAAWLHELTGEVVYLEDARRLREASLRHWFDPTKGTLKDEGKFAHLLVESWLELARVEKKPLPADVRSAILQTAEFLWTRHRDANGRFGNRWDEESKGPRDNWKLIDQASAARLFFSAADAADVK